jgi:Family of unknown function (DUF6526)
MADREQTYKNHARFLPPYHYFVMPVLLVNFLNEIRHVIQAPTRHSIWMVVFAAALLMLGLMARVMALTVQDRVIRLEERMRLRQVLPSELHQHIDTLSRSQLVALRFASDAELADLVRDVVGGKLTTQKEIKMRVRSWRPDWLRA